MASKRDRIRCYESYSGLWSFVFLLDALRARTSLEKVSALNRQRDYVRLGSTPELLPLHLAMNRALAEAHAAWQSYDYGVGYFYQGCERIGVTGLRDTSARIAAMELGRRLAGRTVLEIGCNTGFLSLEIADVARRVVGIDLNPHLVGIGRLAAEHLGISHVELAVSAFEDLETSERFDVVLSFANHATYDRNTRQPLVDYLARCRALLKPGGQLLFESHPPAHEGAGLADVVARIRDGFAVEEMRVLDYGTFLDRGRTFIAARRP